MTAVRQALALLTAVPVRAPALDRAGAGRAMLAAPVAGLAIGAVAAVGLVVARMVLGGGRITLAAALAVATAVAASGGLHLDGLADTADGLGASRTAPLDVMRRGDIGPFGVATVVLTLLVQTLALAACTAGGRGTAALLTAAATGRLAATLACTPGTPAARPDGLGALVAGTVPVRPARVLTAGVCVVAVALATLDEAGGAYAAGRALLAVAAGLAAAGALRRHAVRRLGGVTGDVLGALVEVAATVTLVGLAADPRG